MHPNTQATGAEIRQLRDQLRDQPPPAWDPRGSAIIRRVSGPHSDAADSPSRRLVGIWQSWKQCGGWCYPEKLVTQMEMKMTETRTCAHHWVIEPARGARSAGVCKLCGARNDFANSDRSQAAGPGPRPPELGDRRRGRYTERVLLSVSTAQRTSYRRSAEGAGVSLMPWCRRSLAAAAGREREPVPPSRPSGAYDDRVEITMTPEQETACRAAANRSGQDLAEWMREALDSAVKEKRE